MKNVLLIFLFSFVAFSSSQGQGQEINRDSLMQLLKDNYQNALDDCKNDYNELATKYFTIDSLMQSQTRTIQKSLQSIEGAAVDIQKNNDKIDKIQTKIVWRERLFFGIVGAALGIITGTVL